DGIRDFHVTGVQTCALPILARKPDGAHIREAVLKAGGDPARTVMIGDSATDVNAAKSAGVPCVVVSYGYTEIPPANLGGDALIEIGRASCRQRESIMDDLDS